MAETLRRPIYNVNLPSDRLACLPHTATASSTASRGTDEASTPAEIQFVNRPGAVTYGSVGAAGETPAAYPAA